MSPLVIDGSPYGQPLEHELAATNRTRPFPTSAISSSPFASTPTPNGPATPALAAPPRATHAPADQQPPARAAGARARPAEPGAGGRPPVARDPAGAVARDRVDVPFGHRRQPARAPAPAPRRSPPP